MSAEDFPADSGESPGSVLAALPIQPAPPCSTPWLVSMCQSKAGLLGRAEWSAGGVISLLQLQEKPEGARGGAGVDLGLLFIKSALRRISSTPLCPSPARHSFQFTPPSRQLDFSHSGPSGASYLIIQFIRKLPPSCTSELRDGASEWRLVNASALIWRLLEWWITVSH